MFEDRAAGTTSVGGYRAPRELDVALVAQHRHATGPAPGGCALEVVQGAGRVARGVDPQAEGALGLGLVDGTEIDPPMIVDGHRHRSESGQLSAHRITRVRNRRVQHRVPVGPSQVQITRRRDDELLGTDGGRERIGRNVGVEASRQPVGCSLPSLGETDRRRVATLGTRGGQGGHRSRRRRVTRGTDRQVDQPTFVVGSERLQLVETVVGVRRRLVGGPVTRHRSTPRPRRSGTCRTPSAPSRLPLPQTPNRTAPVARTPAAGRC